jgi:hypothetical protein
MFLVAMILLCMQIRGTLGWRVQRYATTSAEGGSFVLKALSALAFTALNAVVVGGGYWLFYKLDLAPEGWLALAAFVPFLWGVVWAGEQNYSKEEPNEQASRNSVVATH